MLTLFLIIFLALFAILAFKRLNLAVLIVIFALPSYLVRFNLGPIPMTLLEGMILIVVIVWLYNLYQSRKTFKTTETSKTTKNKIIRLVAAATNLIISRSTLFPAMTLFLAAATISLFVAPDLRAAAGIWKAYFIEPVLFFIVLRSLLRNPSQLPQNPRGGDQLEPPLKIRGGSRGNYESTITPQQIVTALSVAALLLSLFAIYQRFTGFGIPAPWFSERRVTSVFPYPNALGLFLGPLTLIFVARLFEIFSKRAFFYDRRKMRGPHLLRYMARVVYWCIIIATSISAIIFAKSTGALVGISVGLFVMVILYVSSRGSRTTAAISSPGKRLPRLPIAIAGLAMTVGVIVFSALLFLAPHSLRTELLLRDWSGHVRRSQWSETIEMLKGRPILGAGLAGYKTALEPYHKATYLEIFQYPHNIALNFWSETGLLGIASFIWLIIVFFRLAFGRIKATSYKLQATSTIAAMTALLIHGLVDVPYFKNDLAMLFWIIYALGLTVQSEST
ncbi:MAG: hypothetical protein UX17_C0018G0001 [Parcubacteria group bacterium GW2011_GWC2_45_7]|uniref:O-antigen ligase-related domain-containing protein n=1 Tax=Candidatus Magasanikbacteria bacterium GW2011_GWA2_50_22 TaxID=1619043 RepID=A0A0G1YRA6_9BACT|nr:MAG: hypothetical protein UX17_C0018G0001 [Parcubacteria group bacterium GW2011_GWC2_45_7]KKW17532.1 MAG: hypothetical protein UY58_C0002G0018 [Candidatus Magasanikbacteria bacterium GW2011_GWA2_50_22]